MKPFKKGHKKKKQPKVIYAGCINLVGLYSTEPIQLKCVNHLDDEEDGFYWDKEGNFDIAELGLDVKDGCIKFASKNKRDVQHWISGAQSAMQQVAAWATDSLQPFLRKEEKNNVK